MNPYKKLVIFATILAFFVVVLGAYVRLSDAGLGCPDWPGCYGHIGAPESAAQQARAVEAFPDKPIEVHKAWKEMIHRYAAGTLGLLVLAIAILAWKRRAQIGTSPALPTVLLVLIIFQAALGMWTVTLLLKPVIVTTHLIGGMTTLALLVWLALRAGARRAEGSATASLRGPALLALAVVALQIVLGGWVSSNYAALACADFPTCNGAWVPSMHFGPAFHLTRELGMNADGGLLSRESLVAIHWVHRVGALITLLVVGAVAMAATRRAPLRGVGLTVLVLLGIQIALGISNVLLSLPLPVAVAHNAVAALLLIALVVLNFRVGRAPRGPVFA